MTIAKDRSILENVRRDDSDDEEIQKIKCPKSKYGKGLKTYQSLSKTDAAEVNKN